MRTKQGARRIGGLSLSPGDAARELREQGVVLLQDIFPADSLSKLHNAATRCFEAIASGDSISGFNAYSHSVLLSALMEFGCSEADLVKPLAAAGLGLLISEAMGCDGMCKMEQSWVRKKFAPRHVAARDYHPQTWHQDGALGVQFPAEAGPVIPMTKLLTCWIPLSACGVDSPGLEFVRGRQDSLLHFTELGDADLREHFQADQFWAPEVEFGEGLVFLDSALHRTYARPEMQRDRMSVEYRIFPG